MSDLHQILRETMKRWNMRSKGLATLYFGTGLLPIKGVVGWCDGAGLTSSAGASYNLDFSRARAYCACSGCGWGCLDIFTLIYPFSLSLGDGPI